MPGSRRDVLCLSVILIIHILLLNEGYLNHFEVEADNSVQFAFQTKSKITTRKPRDRGSGKQTFIVTGKVKTRFSMHATQTPPILDRSMTMRIQLQDSKQLDWIEIMIQVEEPKMVGSFLDSYLKKVKLFTNLPVALPEPVQIFEDQVLLLKSSGTWRVNVRFSAKLICDDNSEISQYSGEAMKKLEVILYSNQNPNYIISLPSCTYKDV